MVTISLVHHFVSYKIFSPEATNSHTGGDTSILNDVEELLAPYDEPKEALEEFKQLIEILEAFDVNNYTLNLGVARGLDYDDKIKVKEIKEWIPPKKTQEAYDEMLYSLAEEMGYL